MFKKILTVFLALMLVLSISACKVEIRNPEESSPEASAGSTSEASSESSLNTSSEEEEKVPANDMTPEEYAEHIGYMTFETITELGYYPTWMQPHTYIIYDENGVPTIIEGGELTPEDLLGREDLKGISFGHSERIEPNTKAEYDLHGFIQNIYYLWPDGNYNLSPYYDIRSAEITYYANAEEFEQEKGKTVSLEGDLKDSIFWISYSMKMDMASTDKALGYPRYKVTFNNNGTDCCFYVDADDIFISSLIDEETHTCPPALSIFSNVESIFNQAQQ